jgi:hypothetical protein
MNLRQHKYPSIQPTRLTAHSAGGLPDSLQRWNSGDLFRPPATTPMSRFEAILHNSIKGHSYGKLLAMRDISLLQNLNRRNLPHQRMRLEITLLHLPIDLAADIAGRPLKAPFTSAHTIEMMSSAVSRTARGGTSRSGEERPIGF